MHSLANWKPVHEQADMALVNSLRQCGIELESQKFRERLHQYYEQRDKDFYETTYHLVLRELLKELGYADIAEAVLRSALDAMYHVTQSNWQMESDTVETLEQLKFENYKLGIFSNAGDNKDVQDLIDTFGIRGHFDFVLTSAACFYRKPHQRAFEIALARWSAVPEEAAMIGDSLDADIFGANQMGMTSIWLTRRAQYMDEDIRRTKPDFSLSSLSELPATLRQIAISRS